MQKVHLGSTAFRPDVVAVYPDGHTVRLFAAGQVPSGLDLAAMTLRDPELWLCVYGGIPSTFVVKTIEFGHPKLQVSALFSLNSC